MYSAPASNWRPWKNCWISNSDLQLCIIRSCKYFLFYFRNRVRSLLKRILKSAKSREIAVYLIFGVLTTAVHWCIYFPLYYKLGSASVSTAIAWAFAVLFAFFTNKPFVFRSHNWSLKVVIPELFKFIGSRLLSGLLEIGIVKLTIDILCLNPIIWKLLTAVIVVVLNYLFSKLFAFRK